VDLTKAPPSAERLAELCRLLGVRPRDLLRTKDPAYEELGLASGKHGDRQLLELMSRHPGLIQRPIVVRDKRAVIARPVETIASLLG
jgi:arsenate reductase